MLRLFLIRHGETDYNRKGIVQGGGIDSSINELGKKQAYAFFETYRHLSFDAVYCSTLIRTYQTLEPWIHTGYEPVKVEALRELGWGHHEGIIPTPEQKAEFLSIRQSWKEGNVHAKVAQGESPQEAWERARDFFEQLYHKHPNQQLLACSHGRQIRVILSALLNKDLSKMDDYEQPNTCLHILNISSSGDVSAEKLSDISHLETHEIKL